MSWFDSGSEGEAVAGSVGGLIVIWGFIPLIFTIWAAFLKVVLPGFGGLHQDFWLTMNTVGNSGGALFWFWMVLASTASVAWLIGMAVENSSKLASIGAALAALLLAFSVYNCVQLGWNDDKNVARYYNTATSFYVPNVNAPPSSMEALFKGATKNNGSDCIYTSPADVLNCIKQGSLPLSGFAARPSSLTGAIAVMQRTSGTTQNVDLMENTVTYLNGNGKDGVWSGIRDGQGSFQPTEGVVEWRGVGNPTECTFGGNDQFKMAFGGTKKNSLTNYIASKYPALIYNQDDMWGYCNSAKQPVIVIPVVEQTRYLSNTVNAPAGVLVVTGSETGTPTLTYQPHAAGLPGPVYAMSMAAAQRENSDWAAGRANKNRGLFGFAPTSSLAQNGNDSEYLLRSNADGHYYWVTPLTLASSQSQLFIAYSLVRADTVTAGKLNPLSIYVLAKNDQRIVNVDNMEATAKYFVQQQDPGFFSGGGSLIEYTPTSGDQFRAFGEINGRVVYRLDISAGNHVQPNLVTLENYNGNGTNTTSKGGPSNAFCGKSPAQLTQPQIVACAQVFVKALKG